MRGDYKIPFNDDGDLLSYAGWGADVVWKDNYKFTDTLRYEGFYRGRSAAGLTFQDSRGKSLPMFLKDFDDLLRMADIRQGLVQLATYTYTKRGANYGIRMVETCPLVKKR